MHIKVYLVAVELLAAWNPDHPGLAVGLGQMSFGLGSIIYNSVFTRLLTHTTVSTTLISSAAVLAVPTAIAAFFLEWPSKHVLHPFEEFINNSYDASDSEVSSVSIPLKKLVLLLPFWFYVLAVLGAQAGFAFIPFFFKISHTFKAPLENIIASFDILFLISTIFRPFAGILADSLKLGTGQLSIGSKNMMFLLLFMQMVMFMLLVPISAFENYLGFVFASGIILTIFAAGACGASILARDLFGKHNSSLVYGVGGSIAIGVGEFVSGELMNVIDLSDKVGTSPNKFNAFYTVCAVWSALGLLSCLMIQKYPWPSCLGFENVHTPLFIPRKSNMSSSDSTYVTQQYGAMMICGESFDKDGS